MSDEDPTLDLNAIMSADPLGLSKQDLDKIIAYQRKQRAAREGGTKTRKNTGDAPAVDIKALMNQLVKSKVEAKPAAPAKGGFVRRF